ncbi:uncharacterized protein F5Z01DRAFT_472151 [Emericellopsis atlantica]|uniref:Uncharacterized protein n=1 Tax=Emericellopsis atlantica TaxID=2614577 RepID=A0A9P8CJS1_9HYPO|nr:uncharacterized protein F5Z01DRAFT_472151 [Emericellopsis atlantica]KAG9249628.1 hypothetical protein F5Z01DRAFT_472151 [Emericellopsis atlantica]
MPDNRPLACHHNRLLMTESSHHHETGHVRDSFRNPNLNQNRGRRWTPNRDRNRPQAHPETASLHHPRCYCHATGMSLWNLASAPSRQVVSGARRFVFRCWVMLKCVESAAGPSQSLAYWEAQQAEQRQHWRRLFHFRRPWTRLGPMARGSTGWASVSTMWPNHSRACLWSKRLAQWPSCRLDCHCPVKQEVVGSLSEFLAVFHVSYRSMVQFSTATICRLARMYQCPPGSCTKMSLAFRNPASSTQRDGLTRR